MPDILLLSLLSLLPAVEGGDVDATLPAVARITSEDLLSYQICTGTLIAPDVVLTAAHCVSPAGSMRVDITGEDATTTLRSFGVRTALAHPAYNPEGNDGDDHAFNDIGLLVLAEEVSADVAAPLPLHRATLADDIAGERVLSFGYGRTQTEESGTKRSVELFIGWLLDDSYSLAGFDLNDVEAGAVTIKKGLCGGDSGGPDFVLGEDAETRELIGVHALAHSNCGLAESTRLDTHLQDFIDPVLAGDVPGGCTGDTLDAASCNAALESGGCGCSTANDQRSSSSLLAALLAALCPLARRRGGRPSSGLKGHLNRP
ncbi:MAG: S1 family peptidase [Myxococcota bacterium]